MTAEARLIEFINGEVDARNGGSIALDECCQKARDIDDRCKFEVVDSDWLEVQFTDGGKIRLALLQEV